MKKIRFFSLAMVLLLVFAALVACQPVVDPDNGEEIDDTKTQLYVYVAKWGFGTEWFKQSKKEYEELNKDRVFEEGKKGIQIIPQYRQSNLSVSEIRGDKINEVFFLEGVPYYSYYTEKLFTDITSYITGENPYEKGVSIESKMTAQQKDGLKIDGKYYAVPGYSGSYGLIYNADLFDENNWYFNAAGEMICEQRVKDKVKGPGPNGNVGDYDDGLPQTYEQFFKLCDKIAAYQDYTPVSWPGTFAAQHLEGLLQTLVADYEGAENISRRINFSGSENRKQEFKSSDSKLIKELADNGISPVVLPEALLSEDYKIERLEYEDTEYIKSANIMLKQKRKKVNITISRYDEAIGLPDMEYMNTEGLEKITVDGVDVYVIIRDDDYKGITYVDRDMYYSIVAEWDIETALEIAKTIK